jgi:hypothetical protein
MKRADFTYPAPVALPLPSWALIAVIATVVLAAVWKWGMP